MQEHPRQVSAQKHSFSEGASEPARAIRAAEAADSTTTESASGAASETSRSREWSSPTQSSWTPGTTHSAKAANGPGVCPRAKGKGKTLQSIMRSGRRLGLGLQHITVAYHQGRNSPGAERKVSGSTPCACCTRGEASCASKTGRMEDTHCRVRRLRRKTCSAGDGCLQQCTETPLLLHQRLHCFGASQAWRGELTCPCMEDSCGPFTIVDFYKIQDGDLRGQIDALTFRKAELNVGERMVHCTKEGCKNRVIVTDESAAAAGHVWECNQCMSFYCIKCEPQVKLCDDGQAAYYNRIVSGEGSGHECTEDKKGTVRRLLNHCALKCRAVFCSNCKNGPIYKEGQGRGFEGCNVVRCPRCKKHVCWVCTKTLSEGSAKAHDAMPHDNDVHGAKGCKLFNIEEKYVHGWRREHSFRDFCAAIRSKGYSKALIQEVMKVPGIVGQFQNERPTWARIQAFVDGLEREKVRQVLLNMFDFSFLILQ